MPSGENTDDTRRGRQQEVAERLSDLVANVGLDPTVARAYTTEASELYTYPGMGPALKDRLDEMKLQSLRNFHALYEVAYGKRFKDPEAQHLIRETRRELGGAGEIMLGEYLLAGLARDPEYGPSVAQAIRLNALGIRQRPLVGAVIKANYLHYFPELGVRDLPLRDDEVLADVQDFALRAEDFQPLHASTLSDRMRRRGLVDLGQAHLDDRRANLLGIIQLEAAGQLLDDLAFLALVKPTTGARTAFALASRYHGALLADDNDGKMALAREVATAYQRYRRQIRSGEARRVLTGAQRDAACVANDLAIMRRLLDRVYPALGYERPITTTAPAFAETAVAYDLADETDVRRRAVALESQWRLSSRSRRSRGFVAIQQALVMGEFESADETNQINAMPKESARQIIDVIVHLYDLAKSLPSDEARSQVAAATEEQRLILDRLGQLRAAARASGKQIDPVAIVPLQAALMHLRTEWPAYRQLLQRKWPKSGGAEAIRLLEPLLFDSETSDE